MFDISGQMMVELLGACQLLNNEDAGPSPGSEHLRGSCWVSSSAFHSAPAMAQQAPGQAEVGSQSPFQGQAQGAQAYESGGGEGHFLWSVYQMSTQHLGYLQV